MDQRRPQQRRVTYAEDRNNLISNGKHDDSSTRRRRKPKRSDEATAQEENGVTDSYLRINHMMKQELERVSAVSSAIDSDGSLLREAKEDQKGMTGVVKGARGTLWLLKAQEMRETIVLWCAVVFFYAAALYVLWTRVKIPFLLW